jgi:hypothetical protein
MCCRLMPLSFLFHLSSICVLHASNCTNAKGCRTRRGSTVCGKNVIRITCSSTANQLEPSIPARTCTVATSARKHAKLCGLSPGGCGAALPPPPPIKPSVSASSETGESNEACCGSSSAAMTVGSAAFARAVRNASRGVASASNLRRERASEARLGRQGRWSRRDSW